jgi:hypothetical protein
MRNALATDVATGFQGSRLLWAWTNDVFSEAFHGVLASIRRTSGTVAAEPLSGFALSTLMWMVPRIRHVSA